MFSFIWFKTLSNSKNIPKRMKIGFVGEAILSYNSFIFNFETGTFTWFFCASKKIFDISRVISVTWKAMDSNTMWRWRQRYQGSLIDSRYDIIHMILYRLSYSHSWNSYGFLRILVHTCIFSIFAALRNILEMLKFVFVFQLLKSFLQWNEVPSLSYVICILIFVTQ